MWSDCSFGMPSYDCLFASLCAEREKGSSQHMDKTKYFDYPINVNNTQEYNLLPNLPEYSIPRPPKN